MPSGVFPKIEYILFFPCFFILYILPNYHVTPSFKKLIFCLILYCSFIIGLLVAVDWLILRISVSFNVNVDIFGMTIVSIGLAAPYLIYNYKFSRRDTENVDFLQTFIELGTFKTSFCIGASMIL